MAFQLGLILPPEPTKDIRNEAVCKSKFIKSYGPDFTGLWAPGEVHAWAGTICRIGSGPEDGLYFRLKRVLKAS